MVYRIVTPLALVAALVPACGQVYTDTATDSSTSTGSTAGSTTTGSTTSDTPTTTEATTAATTDSSSSGTTGDEVPIGGCGAPDFEWLPSDGMGKLVEFEQAIEFADPEVINGLLEDNGFGSLGPVQYGARVYKIRYTTQDRGQPIEVTGFASFPIGMNGQEERTTVIYAHGTTGFSDGCAPTADPTGWQIPMILAAKGFVSVGTDYIGMNGWGAPSMRLHPYIVPEPTAIATLDSARALYDFAATNMSELPSLSGDDIVLFGGSEGGFATLWADRYAPHYAPELHIVANIAAVPPTDAVGLTKHGATVFGPTTGALAAAVVGGWDWTGRNGDLAEVLSAGPPIDLSKELPAAMETDCGFDLPPEITATNQVYQQSFIDAVTAEDWDALGDWGCFLRQASLHGSAIPLLTQTPTLVTQGEVDDLVYTPVVRDDLPRLCDDGYLIEHVECAGAGHSDSVVEVVPYALRWLEDRLEGLPLEEPCVIHAPVDCTQL